MKLYEINERAAAILAALEPDPETGEITACEEDLLEELSALEVDKHEVLSWIAKEQLNTKSEAASLQIEIDRLKKRMDACEARAERLLAVLDRECNGKKTDFGVATLSYRKSKAVVLDDENSVAGWLADNGYDDGIAYSVKVSKAVVKRAIEDGCEVVGAHIEERTKAGLK